MTLFSHGMFMVYLKFVGRKFDITNTDITVSVLFVALFGSVFSVRYRPLIYVCNIYMDLA